MSPFLLAPHLQKYVFVVRHDKNENRYHTFYYFGVVRKVSEKNKIWILKNLFGYSSKDFIHQLHHKDDDSYTVYWIHWKYTWKSWNSWSEYKIFNYNQWLLWWDADRLTWLSNRLKLKIDSFNVSFHPLGIPFSLFYSSETFLSSCFGFHVPTGRRVSLNFKFKNGFGMRRENVISFYLISSLANSSICKSFKFSRTT
jgi:hypothetical protein